MCDFNNQCLSTAPFPTLSAEFPLQTNPCPLPPPKSPPSQLQRLYLKQRKLNTWKSKSLIWVEQEEEWLLLECLPKELLNLDSSLPPLLFALYQSIFFFLGIAVLKTKLNSDNFVNYALHWLFALTWLKLKCFFSANYLFLQGFVQAGSSAQQKHFELPVLHWIYSGLPA